MNADSGPRCVPLIHNGTVFAFGAAGDLYAVDLAKGEPRWTQPLYADLGGSEGYFGAGSTPIVVDDVLLVNVGGRNGAGIVGLEPASGKILWKKTNESASYSSPTSFVRNGKSHVLFVTRMNVVALEPKTGNETFRFEFGKRGPTVNAATPLILDQQRLFVSASYGVGAMAATITDGGYQTIWQSDRSLSSQYATAVYHEGFLYGTHGREDIGVAEFRCVDARSGKIQWSQPGMGVAHVIRAADKLLITSTAGEIYLVRANPKQFELLGKAKVTGKTLRALPALSDGKLYLRDHGGDNGRLYCLDVSRP